MKIKEGNNRNIMQKEEDSLSSRKKPMVVKLNSEQLDEFIKRFPDAGEFFV
ncbi:hypothetical protein NST21_19920 [Peribacillus sp. FSL K6-1552]|uniref:hypothetical protein n=1 Tax=Peribacillus sp. FSL K6-1552 TaxID=2954514 RepID=UPI0030FA95F1